MAFVWLSLPTFWLCSYMLIKVQKRVFTWTVHQYFGSVHTLTALCCPLEEKNGCTVCFSQESVRRSDMHPFQVGDEELTHFATCLFPSAWWLHCSECWLPPAAWLPARVRRSNRPWERDWEHGFPLEPKRFQSKERNVLKKKIYNYGHTKLTRIK